MDQTTALQRLLDRAAITDQVHAYARGVDRQDWELVRSTYHPDALDEHGAYSGNVDGFIDYLQSRHPDIDHSMHVVGQIVIEFASDTVALVETYIVNSQRLRPGYLGTRAPAGLEIGPEDALDTVAFGRLIDTFTCRDGEWRVAHRKLVPEVARNSVAAKADGMSQMAPVHRRSQEDPLYAIRQGLGLK